MPVPNIIPGLAKCSMRFCFAAQSMALNIGLGSRPGQGSQKWILGLTDLDRVYNIGFKAQAQVLDLTVAVFSRDPDILSAAGDYDSMS